MSLTLQNICKLCFITLALITPALSHALAFNVYGSAIGGTDGPFSGRASVTGVINLSNSASAPGANFDLRPEAKSASLSIGGYSLEQQGSIYGTVSNDGRTFSDLSAFFEGSAGPYEVQVGFSNIPPTIRGGISSNGLPGVPLNVNAIWTTSTMDWTGSTVFNFSGLTSTNTPPFGSDAVITAVIELLNPATLPGTNFSSELGDVVNAYLLIDGFKLAGKTSPSPLLGTISPDGKSFSFLSAIFEGLVTVNSNPYEVQVSFSRDNPSVISGNSTPAGGATTFFGGAGSWTVPEPATLWLIGLGFAGIGFGKRRSVA